MKLHCTFASYIEIRVENFHWLIYVGGEFPFINLCESKNLYERNFVQIFELIFCDSER